jgi:hypothetical protein
VVFKLHCIKWLGARGWIASINLMNGRNRRRPLTRIKAANIDCSRLADEVIE